MSERQIRVEDVTIREGKPQDAQDFSQLVLLSAPMFFPYLFGFDVRNVMKNLFQHTKNYFSFEHSYFIEVNGDIAGMALVYNYKQKKQEKLRTSLLLLKYLKRDMFTQLAYLLRSENIVTQIVERDCYLSNIAVYPDFRGLELGTKLLGLIQEETGKTGNRRVVLDAETDNTRAIKLYERLGYNIEQRSPIFQIKDKSFEFFKMCRNCDGNVA